MTYPQWSEGTIMLFVRMVEVVWKWPFIHDESLASSFLKSGFQVHSGLDLPAYEDLDIEFFLFRWRYSKTSDATPPCSALVKLLRRFLESFLLQEALPRTLLVSYWSFPPQCCCSAKAIRTCEKSPLRPDKNGRQRFRGVQWQFGWIAPTF